MAPRTFINKIGKVTIYTSPKCSCRSVSDFAWAVVNSKTIHSDRKINIIVFRNPYRRLISGFLNKYVEHSKYVEAARQKHPGINLATLEAFVDELSRSWLKYIDKVHFSSQISKYKRIPFDMIYNSEDLEPLKNYINTLFDTTEEMPFRVNRYGPKGARTDHFSSESQPPHAEPWKLESKALLEMIQNKQTPAYGEFFNDQLKDITRELYKDDFDFLRSCRDRGIIDHEFHALMTTI
jgi:hypothetical protein